MRKLFAGIDTEKLGKISLQQWIDYLRLSMEAAPADSGKNVPGKDNKNNTSDKSLRSNASEKSLRFAKDEIQEEKKVADGARELFKRASSDDLDDDDVMKLLQEADDLYFSIKSRGSLKKEDEEHDSAHRRDSKPPSLGLPVSRSSDILQSRASDPDCHTEPILTDVCEDTGSRRRQDHDDIDSDTSVAIMPLAEGRREGRLEEPRPSSRDKSETTTGSNRSLCARFMCYCCQGWDEVP